MNCKHCNYSINDESIDVCPNCGKSLIDEPVAEPSDDIELPKVKEENKVELSKEDEFTSNFIKKDDPLKHISNVKTTNTGMMVSRIAALIAVLFFIGVIYYTKVVKPKLDQELKRIEEASHEGDYLITTNTPSKEVTSTGHVEIEAKFGDETVLTQLKKIGVDYDQKISEVDITLNYPQAINGKDFSIVLSRNYYSDKYNDNISFKYNDVSTNGIIRSYTKYNEDLITNFINSYVVYNINGTIVMYTKQSTFQLGNPTTILIFKDSSFNKIEKVITTYSTDGVSITQCPIVADESGISYCSLTNSFEKGKETEINKVKYQYDKTENITEKVIGLVSK